MRPKFVYRRPDVRSLVGRSGSRAFQTIHQSSGEGLYYLHERAWTLIHWGKRKLVAVKLLEAFGP